ncbi:MAG: TIGR00153 family protein [Gammaproteobacteria bacterium]|nr:TIGR00153 family protein [Gammaproteobacteria bacterium]
MANYLDGIFGRSPFKPVQQHMDLCHRAAALVEELLTHSSSQAWSDVEKVQQQIVDLERQADERKRDIRIHLPRGFFLPVARADLLDLLTRQDKIANKAKDIAGLMVGRKMSFPAEMAEPLSEFTEASVAACKLALDAVGEFDELITAGFRGEKARRVEHMISELDDSETRSDDAQVKVRTQLHALERDLHPVDVIFLYRVIDRIGDLADNAQRVGHRLEMMLAK